MLFLHARDMQILTKWFFLVSQINAYYTQVNPEKSKLIT